MRPGQTNQERIDAARATGHYEQWRARFTQWVTVDGLTNNEIMQITGLSNSGVRMTLTVLGLVGADRPVSPTRWRRDDAAMVRTIRAYTTAWDRGW